MDKIDLSSCFSSSIYSATYSSGSGAGGGFSGGGGFGRRPEAVEVVVKNDHNKAKKSTYFNY